MHAASRASLAVIEERLETVTAGLDEPALTRLADDAESVSRLLGREVGLRRALTNPARPPDARRDLMRALLTGKVSEPALDVLGELAAAQWSSGADLLDAAEQLAVETLLIGADRAGELAEVEDELFRFVRVVSGPLAVALGDASSDVTRRIRLVRDLLEGKARRTTVRLAEFAVGGFGGRTVDTALYRLVELTAGRRTRRVAYVRVAAPLTEQQETRLAARLTEIYGREIGLHVQVDPALLGGATVRVGDDLYDGSVARRLAAARSAFAK